LYKVEIEQHARKEVVVKSNRPVRGTGLFLVSVLLLSSVGCSGMNARRELAALQESLEASELPGSGRYVEFIPQFEAFAVQFHGTEAALTAKLWLLEQTGLQSNAGTRHSSAGQIADEILEEYPRSPQLGRMVELSSVFSNEQREKYFGILCENSPHKEVRAPAVYTLAAMGERTEDEQLIARRNTLLQELIDDYGDVALNHTTYGVMADALLYPHDPADLEIGMPAPEIVGVTADGEEIRLSDFRGRVVVIDFWGDW